MGAGSKRLPKWSQTPTVRRSPEDPLANRALTRSVPPSRRALTSTPGDGRADWGSEPVAAAEPAPDKLASFAKTLAQRAAPTLQVFFPTTPACPTTPHTLSFSHHPPVCH